VGENQERAKLTDAEKLKLPGSRERRKTVGQYPGGESVLRVSGFRKDRNKRKTHSTKESSIRCRGNLGYKKAFCRGADGEGEKMKGKLSAGERDLKKGST